MSEPRANDEVRLSRLRVSRRRALAIGGSVTLSGLLAACNSDGDSTTQAGTTATTESAPATTPAAGGAAGLLERAPTCVMTPEQTEGPYWFDVDSIRDDVREGRPGTRLDLALRVQDLSKCADGGPAAQVSNAVVEIWHCDAGGVYSGFESASQGGGGERDDGTYLRGAQPTGRDGIARFTTIYPGWYMGRAVHIHLKAHIDKRTVLTTQLYFDEQVNTAVFETSPYDERPDRDTFNDDDNIYDKAGLLTLAKRGDGYLGAINLGINA